MHCQLLIESSLYLLSRSFSRKVMKFWRSWDVERVLFPCGYISWRKNATLYSNQKQRWIGPPLPVQFSRTYVRKTGWIYTEVSWDFLNHVYTCVHYIPSACKSIHMGYYDSTPALAYEYFRRLLQIDCVYRRSCISWFVLCVPFDVVKIWKSTNVVAFSSCYKCLHVLLSRAHSLLALQNAYTSL